MIYFSPLEQFKINPIIRIYNNWFDLTISNSTIYLLLGIVLIIIIINYNINNNLLLLKSRWGFMIEKLYLEVEGLVKNVLPLDFKNYLPLTFILFLFILINNLIGLVPYSFTTTSHFIVTLLFSLSIMIGVTLIGISIHKFKFFHLFIPSGLNKGGIKFVIPLIFSIEIISYLIRVISLAVRLTANLLSGHTLLKILANFGLKYTISFPILIILPISLLSCVFLLEIGVSIIQAYVFTLLTITYISDMYKSH